MTTKWVGESNFISKPRNERICTSVVAKSLFLRIFLDSLICNAPRISLDFEAKHEVLYHFRDFLFNFTCFPLFFTPFLVALNFTDFFTFLSCWDFRCFVSLEDFSAVSPLSSGCLLFFPGFIVSLEFLLLRVFGKSSREKNKQETTQLAVNMTTDS